MHHGRDFTRIIEAARIHYENLRTDIANASNRIEHIRLTALAQEAHNLYSDLRVFETGLVYTHTASVDINLDETINEDQTPLDLPEFKSPFDPRHNVL